MNFADKNFANVPKVWEPSETSGKKMKEFMKSIEDKYNKKFDDYWSFHQWSCDNLSEFWAEMWDYCGVICSKKYEQVIDTSIPMEELPEWFKGAELNFAENLLKRKDDLTALIVSGEDRETEHLTYAQLNEEAKAYAAAFRNFGVKKGDVVACFMSNRKEAILGMLGTVSVGAIWTGSLPQMGHEAVLNRITQVSPKILLTVDRYSFFNEEVEMLGKVEQIAEGLPSLKKVIIVPSKEESKLKDISNIKNSCFLDEFLELGKAEDGTIPPIKFEQVPVSHPVFINFTSGTTGLPKTIVHGSGILLPIFRDYIIHMDSEVGDIFLSMSPIGWASWTIFTTLLFCEKTVLLFEGHLFFSTPTSLWDSIDENRISHALLSASVLDDLEKKRYLPVERHNLKSVKLLMSGASVVKLKSYDFVYNELKLNAPFSEVYGGTEMMGCCSGMNLTMPIYKGEIPVSLLGMKVEILDGTGKSVEGEIGEVVVSKPFPSLILKLWADADGSVLREKYFSKYPGKFSIGDFGIINPVTKGLKVCGRCDETLKQRGCRFGPSEIYNVVDKFPEVYDSVCAAQYNKDMDERAVLFLQMRDGHAFSEQLVNRLQEDIARDLTPRHVPDVIVETKDIPYNRNGKKMEITVKKVINNWSYIIEDLRNPESLKHFLNRTDLQGF